MTIQTFKSNVFPVQAKLFRLAKTMLPDEEDAEDTVQEALLKLWQNRHNLTNYRSIEALAMVITKNLCLDKLKASHRQRMVPMSPATDAVDRTTPYQQIEQSDSAPVATTTHRPASRATAPHHSPARRGGVFVRRDRADHRPVRQQHSRGPVPGAA